MILHRFRRVAASGMIFAAALAVAGCSTGPNVRTDHDASVDFSRYRSFSWVYTAPPTGMNPLAFQRVRDSIDRELQTRFTPADPGDFAVAFTLGRRDSVQVTDFGPYGPYYRGWGWGGAWGGRNVDVRNVTEGTLVIDIYDTATKRPIWHGVATQEVNPNRPPSQEVIDTAIREVLSRFPPAPGSN